MYCSPPGSSVHGISQPRILEWVAMSSSRGSSGPRDQTPVSCICRWILYRRAIREADQDPLGFADDEPLHQADWGLIQPHGPFQPLSCLSDPLLAGQPGCGYVAKHPHPGGTSRGLVRASPAFSHSQEQAPVFVSCSASHCLWRACPGATPD